MTTLYACYYWCIVMVAEAEYRKRIDCLIDRAHIEELARLDGREKPVLKCIKN